ncbi:hypothetical protein [uncultured Shewanella sp.]|uniref:hypothetical protein n=1 Tax=uncultured Shewanella sp. TaxID=173975 RepID=UPI002637AFF7|nr:hypothetical protein [uncultured Shewanella sp.]
MLTLTTMIHTAKKGLVSFVLFAGLTVSAHADSLLDMNLSRHIENSLATQMDEAANSLKSELSLLIQLQMAEMLFDHEFEAILETQSKTVIDDAEADMWGQE